MTGNPSFNLFLNIKAHCFLTSNNPENPILKANWEISIVICFRKHTCSAESLVVSYHEQNSSTAMWLQWLFHVGSVWAMLLSHSVNHRLGWYWCDLAGLRGANPYDAATWGCAGNTAAGCICAGRGWVGWVANTGLALAWCAGGGSALLKHMQKNLLEQICHEIWKCVLYFIVYPSTLILNQRKSV